MKRSEDHARLGTGLAQGTEIHPRTETLARHRMTVIIRPSHRPIKRVTNPNRKFGGNIEKNLYAAVRFSVVRLFASPAQNAPPARPDLYHVHFAKAALGKGGRARPISENRRSQCAHVGTSHRPAAPGWGRLGLRRHPASRDQDHCGSLRDRQCLPRCVICTHGTPTVLSTAHLGLISAKLWALTRARPEKP